MVLTKQEAVAKYDTLWDTMELDFADKLDAPTYNEFEHNVSEWAGFHKSEATAEVATAIWNELHEPTIVEASTPGHYRDRFTGLYRSRADYEEQEKR
jgi:hypothetical protein